MKIIRKLLHRFAQRGTELHGDSKKKKMGKYLKLISQCNLIILLLFGFHSNAQKRSLDPPANLSVDTLTSLATWNTPSDTTNLLGYSVFLDDSLVSNTTDTLYKYPYLIYGQTYIAGVTAIYITGYSDTIYHGFVSGYLIPPTNLQVEGYDNSAYLTWNPPLHTIYYNSYNSPDYHPLISGQPIRNLHHEIKPLQNIISLDDKCLINSSFTAGPIGYMNDIQRDLWLKIYVTNYKVYSLGFIDYEYHAGDFARGNDNMMFGNCIINDTSTLVRINIETGLPTVVAPLPCPLADSNGVWRGFACDKYTGIMYAICSNNNQSMLCTINLSNAEVTQIGSTTTAPDILEIAYNTNTETMYGWSGATDNCYTIDINTGEATLLGPIGFDANGEIGGSWNPWDEKIYLTSGYLNGIPRLRILDQTTGYANPLTMLYGQMSILGFPGSVGDSNLVPDNIIAYKIYRNGDSIGQVDHPDFDYFDNNLLPENYSYTLTAIYDLTPYGFSNQYGESLEAGPAYLLGISPYTWPFWEDWSHGSFEANSWIHDDCENWKVDLLPGGQNFCAVFSSDSVRTNYCCKLVSHPIGSNLVIDGSIYLDFDIKLSDNTLNGTEALLVYLRNNNDSIFPVTEYKNNGSLHWLNEHKDITGFANEQDFTVVFEAKGDCTNNIHYWGIDNIHIYRKCLPPENLEVEFGGNQYTYAQLTWDVPDSNISINIGYNDGSIEDCVASGNGGAGIGQLFKVSNFQNLTYPFTITKVKYFNYNYRRYWEEETIYILSEDGSEILGGPYYKLNGPPNDWTTVLIDSVVINTGNFFVATMNTYPCGPCIGIDDDFYNKTLFFGSIGAWSEMSQYGYYSVGSHEVYVTTELGEQELSYKEGISSEQINQNSDNLDMPFMGNMDSPGNYNQKSIIGFNIWKSQNSSEWYKINSQLVTKTKYKDYDIWNGTSCYYITTVYEQCESDSSNNECIMVVSSPEEKHEDREQISIYPVPSNDYLNIESQNKIIDLKVIDFSGIIIDERELKSIYQYDLDISTLNEGIYLISIKTTEGITNKKFIVIK